MRIPVATVACNLLSLVASSSAQELDPIVNFCVRFDHQSALKNGTIYVDGGRETFIDVTDSGNQVGQVTQGYNDYLIAIDMTVSWNWKTNISQGALAKTANPKTGTQPPVLSRGALYSGTSQDDNIYLWGGTTSYSNTSFIGYQPPTPQQYSLWSYNTVSKVWDQFDETLSSPHRPNGGSFTYATDQGLAFYFNGELDSGSEIQTESFGSSVKQYLEGMIVIDTNNRTARNLSTRAVVGDMPRSRGRMQYISAIGENGILVQIGGNQQSITNTTDGYTNGDLLPMNEVDVFDVSTYYDASTPDGIWYKQATSGDTPDPRVDFCLILASADDGTSHNIYMYGGRGNNNYFIDDVWVLSLPSFTWTKIYQGTSPRYGHTCHRVGNRTMITVGGAANVDYGSTPCDWETKGVGVFDISDLIWGSVFNAFAGVYTVPSLVTASIGGSPSGGATMNQPSGGFNQSGLAKLFHVPSNSSSGRPFNSSLPSLNSSVPANSSVPTSNPRPNSHIFPVVGGVTGSITFVALTAFLGFFYRKRIWHWITGDPWPFLEMDGEQRRELEGDETVHHEAMDRELRWELPANEKPIELWSPTDRDSKPGISGAAGRGPKTFSSRASNRDTESSLSTPGEREVKPVQMWSPPPVFSPTERGITSISPPGSTGDTKATMSTPTSRSTKTTELRGPTERGTRPVSPRASNHDIKLSYLTPRSRYAKAPTSSPIDLGTKPLPMPPKG